MTGCLWSMLTSFCPTQKKITVQCPSKDNLLVPKYIYIYSTEENSTLLRTTNNFLILFNKFESFVVSEQIEPDFASGFFVYFVR